MCASMSDAIARTTLTEFFIACDRAASGDGSYRGRSVMAGDIPLSNRKLGASLFIERSVEGRTRIRRAGGMLSSAVRSRIGMAMVA